MILFLYGKDTFRSKQQLAAMTQKFRADRDPQGLNIFRLDMEKKQDAVKALEHVMGVPFLAEKKMVVIENLLSSKEKELQQAFLDRVEAGNVPETTVLVFWEGADKYKTKLAKECLARLQKEKYAQKFDELTGMKLQGWIVEEVQSRDGSMARDAMQFLAQHGAGDMWRLSSLIDQLVAYASGREIVLEDAQLFLDEKVDDNIFNLVDAIVGGQQKKVYAQMQEQYRLGKDAGYVFAMVLRQFRILLQLRDMFERDDSLRSDSLAKELGLHPFVVKKSLPTVKRYTSQALQDIYGQLLDIDVQTKTGRGNQRQILDVFVGRLAVTGG